MVGDSSANLPLTGTFAVTHTTGPRYVTVAAPSVVAAGGTTPVSATFTNGSTETVRNATLALAVPNGWTAGAPDRIASVAPGKSVTATWQVTVPADAEAGAATLTASASYAHATVTGTATVQVPYPTLAAATNNTAISDDADPAGGNFDGGGYSYSAQALASVGLTPGAKVTHDGLTFEWPNVPAATPDNVVTSGQTIALSGQGGQLAFLGAGAFGTQTGQVTVTYTDGTTSTGTITMSDWYSNAAVTGDEVVATTPHWNIPAGSTLDPNHKVSVYYSAVPLSAGKTVAAVTLPNNTNLHVFALTTG
jgi:beta-glucosidase